MLVGAPESATRQMREKFPATAHDPASANPIPLDVLMI
jgi:hypothetical protein